MTKTRLAMALAALLFVAPIAGPQAEDKYLPDFRPDNVPREYLKAWRELETLGGYADPVYYKMLQLGRGIAQGERLALHVTSTGKRVHLPNGNWIVYFYILRPADSQESKGQGAVGALYSSIPAALTADLQVQGWVFGLYQGAIGGYPLVIPESTVLPRTMWAMSSQSANDIAPIGIKKLEVKIGIVAPLSGPVPSFGVSTRNGAMLAIDQWNSRGGVAGMLITALVEDGQCTADPAIAATNRLIDQNGVHFLIGEVCSKASIPMSEVANARRVVQISPGSTNLSVTVDKTGTTKPYVFRACFIDPFEGTVAAKFAFKSLKRKRAFIMTDPENDYVNSLANSFEQTFRHLGGKIVGKAQYNGATDTDFSRIISDAKASSPDIIYLPDYYNVVNLVIRHAKDSGLGVPFIGGDGWDSADLDLTAADGSYYTNHYAIDDKRPLAVAFRTDYGAAYKEANGQGEVPDALAALAYDATNMLLEGIDKAGSDQVDAVRLAIEKISFQGVTGKLTFDQSHNPIKTAVIMAVHGGRVVLDTLVDPD